MRRAYGAHPLHLLTMVACLALVGYLVWVLGPEALWNPQVWWKSVAVWFAGSVVAHDLVLFPLYALADRTYVGLAGLLRGQGSNPASRATWPPALNHLRVPVLASGLLFVLFWPGILEHGAATYVAATGQTQEPFLGRWLLLTGVFFAISAVTYAVRLRRTP